MRSNQCTSCAADHYNEGFADAMNTIKNRSGMTKTKELLAWQYAMQTISLYSTQHPCERMRDIKTWETADASGAIALIAEQIERLTKEAGK